MIRFIFLFIISTVMFIMAGCGANNEASQDTDYDQTKKMVVDILQTDDGKKALQEIITDDNMKQHLVMESDTVKEAITEALVSDKGAQMWQKLFEDPDFVKSFQESMEDEQKKLYKSLMNDSDYQEQMLDLLQNPEISDQTLKLMKSQQYRAHLEETIQQTLETPTFQAKMQEVLLKAAEKQQQSSGGQGSGGGGGESQGEGGEGQGGSEDTGGE